MKSVTVPFIGKQLLESAKFNKDTAFTIEERKRFKLEGMLPNRVETLEEQASRHYEQFCQLSTNMQKTVYLNELHNRNEILFYKLVSEHMLEMLPIIYTPTVGDLVEQFSLQFRRQRGLYLSYEDRNNIDAILENRINKDLDLIVVTDGSAVLGIGDQGVGGVEISIGKLMVYTAVGGVNPHRVLPMVLDVGTNNKTMLNDPMYLGWRHERLSGKEYDDFIDLFVQAVRRKFPNVLLHWEDFDKNSSLKILNRYRKDMFTFNDDIQGTGGVTVACVLAGLRGINGKISKQRLVFHGAGSATVGIADQFVSAMVDEGLSLAEARNNIWMLNSRGLVTEKSAGLSEFQLPYARKMSELGNWKLKDVGVIDLHDVVVNVKPTVLIGCSTVAGAFTEEIVKEMAKHTPRPIILPLSNPSSKSEAHPKDVIEWTDGKALVATGSPFADVDYKGKTYPIAQCNNALIFPALGLGAIAAKATRVSDGMIRAASSYLSSQVKTDSDVFALLPSLKLYPEMSFKIALAVANKAREEGLAGVAANVNLEEAIKNIFWIPEYYKFTV